MNLGCAGKMDDVDVIAEALHEAAVDVEKFFPVEVQQNHAAITIWFWSRKSLWTISSSTKANLKKWLCVTKNGT